MRFRVQNISRGYCEIWVNERDGKRYRKLAVVRRDRDGSWHWAVRGGTAAPFEDWAAYSDAIRTYALRTRRECILDCERCALMRLVDHAIERQPKESPHWHSPRRDAMADIRRSRLFTKEEKEEIKSRLETFE